MLAPAVPNRPTNRPTPAAAPPPPASLPTTIRAGPSTAAMPADVVMKFLVPSLKPSHRSIRFSINRTAVCNAGARRAPISIATTCNWFLIRANFAALVSFCLLNASRKVPVVPNSLRNFPSVS